MIPLEGIYRLDGTYLYIDTFILSTFFFLNYIFLAGCSLRGGERGRGSRKVMRGRRGGGERGGRGVRFWSVFGGGRFRENAKSAVSLGQGQKVSSYFCFF